VAEAGKKFSFLKFINFLSQFWNIFPTSQEQIRIRRFGIFVLAARTTAAATAAAATVFHFPAAAAAAAIVCLPSSRRASFPAYPLPRSHVWKSISKCPWPRIFAQW